jgi:Domain of unknown function (DUF4365)
VVPDVRYRGAFAEYYVRALALAAGLNVLHATVDDDGVDAMIRYSGEVGVIASPGIDVQVKSWSNPAGSSSAWHYDGLNQKQYNKLVGDNYQMPRYLVLLIVPKDQARLAELLDDGLLLRHCAYFTSIADKPRIAAASSGSSRRVHVPKANLLTASALRGLLHPDLNTAQVRS